LKMLANAQALSVLFALLSCKIPAHLFAKPLALGYKRISAGTVIHASEIKISPGTKSDAASCTIFPPLRTVAVNADIFFNASIAFSARYSCTKPMIALSSTMINITKASF